jgi:hypothetical protein
MKSNYIQEAYDSVKVFNQLAGNLNAVTLAKVDNQVSLCFEELTETIDGVEAKDMTELLDGACDMFVVGAGLLQQLEAAGFDVARALKRVTDNNLTKFPLEMSTEDMATAKAAGYSINFDSNNYRYVLKNSAGKVMKPAGYKSVKLNDLTGKLV